MSLYTIPEDQISDENARVRALDQYHILDTLPEKEYDDITKIASFICKTPVSLIALMDNSRNWFKSIHGDTGLAERQTPRDVSFCKITIQGDDLYQIPDTKDDALFHSNPLVSEHNIRFYAGYPLINSDGYKLGTLCVIDYEPRKLDLAQREALRTLANQVITTFELSKSSESLRQKNDELTKANARLDHFSTMISHDLKSPLQSIKSLYELTKFEKENKEKYVSQVIKYVDRMGDIIDGMLAFVRDDYSSISKEKVDTAALVKEIANGFKSSSIKLRLSPNLPTIETERTLLTLVFQNLISNAIKYSDKSFVDIHIGAQITDELVFSVSDNGPGIDKSIHEDIFLPFQKADDRKVSGSGIGLYTVKTIVEQKSCKVWLVSKLNEGSTFYFQWTM